MNKISIHAYISGLVQGVYFRQSTLHKANELGLTGWVRNLKDGRVEVFASGDAEKLQILVKWLWQGPITAKVTDVITEEKPWQQFENFSIL